MKKPAHHLIAEVPRKHAKVELTIGIDLGDVWSHYCTLNRDGEVIDRGRFRTTPKAINKWFTDVPHARVAMEAGASLIWTSEQLEQLGHEVIVANVRELRAISHSDRKSDDVDAEKLARYARLDPEIPAGLSPHGPTAGSPDPDPRSRAFGSTANRSSERSARIDQGLRSPHAGFVTDVLRSTRQAACRQRKIALGPILTQIAEMTLKIKQYDKEIQRSLRPSMPRHSP